MNERNVALEATIKKLTEAKKYASLRDFLATLNAVDIAEAFSELSDQALPLVFRLLPKELAAEVFVEMEAEQQETLIRGFSDVELKAVVEELYVDDAVDLIDDLIIQCAHLADDLLAGKFLNGCNACNIGILADDDDLFRYIIRSREVDRLTSCRCICHAGNDRIDLTIVQGRDQVIPVCLDDLNIHAESFSDLCCDHDVITVAEVNGRDLLCGFSCFSRCPVERSVVAFHTDTQYCFVFTLCIGTC